MQPATAKDLMFKSVCFRLVLGLTVTLGVVSMILGIIGMNVTCSHHSSCSSSFYYSPYECKSYGVSYCCGNYYDSAIPNYSCGGYGYCYKNPNPYSFCMGLTITARSFMGLTLMFLIIMWAMMCHFRRVKNRREKHTYNQPLLFSSQDQWLRYQQAQISRPPNNQLSINAHPPTYPNQYPLNTQNKPSPRRIQVNIQHSNGELLTEQ